MARTDYILRSLSKISKKRWEHYVVNRIYHRLNDPEVEFVCQQCVRKDDRKIYLTDLFFPQLNMYLEIDEGHHELDQAKIADAKRRFDIADAAGLAEERLKTAGVSLDTLNDDIDGFVQKIRDRKEKEIAAGTFRVWDYEHRFTAQPHRDVGYIDVGPEAAFWTHREALSCFGYTKGHYQRAVWTMPSDISKIIGLSEKSVVWFPKLYEDANWNNSLSDDGLIVTEINKNPDHCYDEPWDRRVIMARSRDELNRTLYRFVGVFEVVPEYKSGNEHRFRRVATRVNTYPQKP